MTPLRLLVAEDPPAITLSQLSRVVFGLSDISVDCLNFLQLNFLGTTCLLSEGCLLEVALLSGPRTPPPPPGWKDLVNSAPRQLDSTTPLVV